MPRRPVVAAAVLVTLAACRPATPPATPAPVPSAAAPARRAWPGALKWVRTSAEYRALVLQVYRLATARVLDAARGRDPRTWAVILDADETVLDNSEEERRTAEAGLPYGDSVWVAWVRERAAGAVPGAAEFIGAVQRAGGFVAIVTNRADSLCADTRANLEAIHVHADAVLCKPAGSDGKDARFALVQAGQVPGARGPMAVLAWVGDNIQDFPALTQSARDDAGALAPFGTRYFVLPNPMYGSWTRNAER